MYNLSIINFAPSALQGKPLSKAKTVDALHYSHVSNDAKRLPQDNSDG